MAEDILDPLGQFPQYRQKFHTIAGRTFEELTKASGIDIEANKKLSAEIAKLRISTQKAEKSLNRLRVWSLVMWMAWFFFLCAFVLFPPDNNIELMLGILISSLVAAFVVQFAAIRPKIKNHKKVKNKLADTLKKKEKEAWAQMEPLNRLYDWDIFSRMVSEAVPRIEFDPYFTTQRLEDLVHSYGWDESFSKSRQRSVLFSHSGLINGNPFVIARTLEMQWGTKSYTGQRVVTWTETVYDSNGNRQTVTRSETLYATIYKPFPDFFDKTRLVYGNTAAPDLTFKREKNGKDLEAGSGAYRRKLRKIERFARDMKNDFAMSTNEEFEVLFTTKNRSDNQQYFLLFTPLAQENMIKLIRDKQSGYGDDFEFVKNRKLNTITADHLDNLQLDLNPKKFWNYSYEAAKRTFIESTLEHFRSIYFAFAPLLNIPLYQQLRPASDIYGTDMPRRSSYLEHEALANFWGERTFAHPACVTQSILKTTATRGRDDSVSVQVQAHGFRSESHVEYVPTYCSNGRTYNVPVYWDEYIPVTGTGSFKLKEDNSEDAPGLDPLTRLRETLRKTGAFGDSSILRRHILSRL